MTNCVYGMESVDKYRVCLLLECSHAMTYYSDVTWASWRLKSPTTRRFVRQIVLTNSKGWKSLHFTELCLINDLFKDNGYMSTKLQNDLLIKPLATLQLNFINTVLLKIIDKDVQLKLTVSSRVVLLMFVIFRFAKLWRLCSSVNFACIWQRTLSVLVSVKYWCDLTNIVKNWTLASSPYHNTPNTSRPTRWPVDSHYKLATGQLWENDSISWRSGGFPNERKYFMSARFCYDVFVVLL